MASSKGKVGELLIRAGVIDEAQLAIATAEQARVGGRLGQILIDLGFATEEELSGALASQTGVDQIDLEQQTPEADAVKLVPEELARRRELIPLQIDAEGCLVVAMVNPTDIVAIDELERVVDRFVRVLSASRRQVSRAIERSYRGLESAEDSLETLIRRAVAEAGEPSGQTGGGAMVEVVDELLRLAIRREATDVHFEPDTKVVRVRFRVDGELQQGPTLAAVLASAAAARVKVLAGLNIAETRIPQDGTIRLPVDNRKVDLRVSTLPVLNGESVVLRVLDRGRQGFSLGTLGISEQGKQVLLGAARRPNGMILAAGPTGSGKTTTLYSLLREASSPRRKVITLEDPVEYELPVVTQCQINEKGGVTFASGLRAILRHDPDVVLVGEMRDGETSQIAMRAALTGHLVLSTLHTNDSVRAISRLRDMGIEPFLIASCLSAVVGQRLVRLNCTACREAEQPVPEALDAAGFPQGTSGGFMRGRGCSRCNQTGMKGRQAVFEVLDITPDVVRCIARDEPVDVITEAARRNGLVTFREEAQRKALAGEIPIEEVARVTSDY